MDITLTHINHISTVAAADYLFTQTPQEWLTEHDKDRFTYTPPTQSCRVQKNQLPTSQCQSPHSPRSPVTVSQWGQEFGLFWWHKGNRYNLSRFLMLWLICIYNFPLEHFYDKYCQKNSTHKPKKCCYRWCENDRLKLHFKVYHFAAISLVLKPLYTHCPPT